MAARRCTTRFSAAVPAAPHGVLMGTAGSIELVGGTKLVVRRVDADPGTIEFPSPAPRTPDPALVGFFALVAEAVRTGTQIAPSFDDGVAVAEAMDRLRGNAIAAAS